MTELCGSEPLANAETREGDCCRRNVPAYSGYRQDGEEFVCPECQSSWEWLEDEAEGGRFERMTWGLPSDGTELLAQ